LGGMDLTLASAFMTVNMLSLDLLN
jgi:hypothetical protein